MARDKDERQTMVLSLGIIGYHFLAKANGGNPNSVTNEETGGTKMIAVVDTYDNSPNAMSNLAAYSAQFGSPAPTAANFEVVFATGSRAASANGTGWDIEEAPAI